LVIPAKAGIHSPLGNWMPAFAGMTTNSALIVVKNKNARSRLIR
jgi:hypothetical protein